MRVLKKFLVLTLCMVFTINCTMISRAEEKLLSDTNDGQAITFGNLRAAPMYNEIKKVTISPAYFDANDNIWRYYSGKGRMETYYPQAGSIYYGPRYMDIDFSSSIWSGLNTTHVRVEITFDHRSQEPVTPYIDGKKMEPINYDPGTCIYRYYYIPERNHVTRNVQLYFGSGPYKDFNINTSVKEWR